MAWPKLRNKSSGPLMTASNRSGAAHDGARWQEKAPEGASEGPAREPGRGTEGVEGTERVQDAPVTWPGQAADASRSGIGERRGNLAHLSANPRMRIWQLRAVVAVVILAAFWILVDWKLGLTLAVVAIIADTIYRARKGYAGKVRQTAAQ